jgi:hypothetical protein
MMLDSTHDARREKAPVNLKTRTLFSAPWHWTDDTNIVGGIVVCYTGSEGIPSA